MSDHSEKCIVRVDPEFGLCNCGAQRVEDDRAEVLRLRAEVVRLDAARADAVQRAEEAYRKLESWTRTPPDEFPEKCYYCHGVGACPRCWGRAAITALESERERLAAALLKCKNLTRYQETSPLTVRQVGEMVGRIVDEARAALRPTREPTR